MVGIIARDPLKNPVQSHTRIERGIHGGSTQRNIRVIADATDDFVQNTNPANFRRCACFAFVVGLRYEISVRHANVESRLRARFDPSLVLQPEVSLQYSGHTNALLSSQSSNGWNAIADLERSLTDLLLDLTGNLQEQRGLQDCHLLHDAFTLRGFRVGVQIQKYRYRRSTVSGCTGCISSNLRLFEHFQPAYAALHDHKHHCYGASDTTTQLGIYGCRRTAHWFQFCARISCGGSGIPEWARPLQVSPRYGGHEHNPFEPCRGSVEYSDRQNADSFNGRRRRRGYKADDRCDPYWKRADHAGTDYRSRSQAHPHVARRWHHRRRLPQAIQNLDRLCTSVAHD